MRPRLLIMAALLAAAAPPALAQSASSAQAAYVERRGLIEVDAQCHVLAPEVRAALMAGAGQARRTLLASGWSSTQLNDLEQATIRAARARPCDDARTRTAADSARAGYAGWARLTRVEFPGWERTWAALRYPDDAGWRLRQSAPDANAAVFGVLEKDGAAHLAVSCTLAPTARMPATAEIVMRDPARARANLASVPGRNVTGLEAFAPSPASSRSFIATARWSDTARNGVRTVTFTFPDAAFDALTALDPREAAEVRWSDGRRSLVEVGDLAAARVFLAAQAAG